MTNDQDNVRQGPLRPAANVYIGRRWHGPDTECWPNGAPVGRRDKHQRRMLRRRLMTAGSRIAREIRDAQRERANVGTLSMNSHDLRRNLEALRNERMEVKWWTERWLSLWGWVGRSYAKMLEIARRSVR